MSKSIYDEALEIIDNNTFELGKGLDVLKPTYRDTVVKALEQAQKQEKLLELYKKQNAIYEKLMTMELSQLALDSNYYQLELIKIRSSIKELESEK